MSLLSKLLRTHSSVYSLYGLNLASDFPFTYPLPIKSGKPDVTFNCITEAPINPEWRRHPPIYAIPRRPNEDESSFYIYQYGNCEIIRYTDRAHFYLWPTHIVCELLDASYHFAIEIWLLGGVLTYWLERQGIPALHAAAVVIDDNAVAFLSTNKGGKSSLAASLMQLSYPLLSDDILPIEYRDSSFIGRPGYPQMRMWPDQAQHFLGYFDELEKVQPAQSKRRIPVGAEGFGTFCLESQPLKCLYLPERHDDESGKTTIIPLSVKEAVVELVRHSFMPYAVTAAGLEAQRFNFFAKLIQQVPMRRLSYPSGLEYLPKVRQVVLQDLSALSRV